MAENMKMRAAEEVFLIVRELSKDATFRWKDWVDAYDAVYGRPFFSWQRTDTTHRHVHMSANKCLRIQMDHGTIAKIGRGKYRFLCGWSDDGLVMTDWWQDRTAIRPLWSSPQYKVVQRRRKEKWEAWIRERESYLSARRMA